MSKRNEKITISTLISKSNKVNGIQTYLIFLEGRFWKLDKFDAYSTYNIISVHLKLNIVL